jgi:hypothetical protein
MHALQHQSVSEDRIKQLMASLNKAREQSEQYARCRLELREVENEPPPRLSGIVVHSAVKPVDKVGKGQGDEHRLCTQDVHGAAERVCSFCFNCCYAMIE